MSSQSAQNVSVTLLGKEYMIACPPGAEAELQQAVDLLSGKMNEIRGAGKTVGLERIAILAALNISHELIQERNQASHHEELEEKLKALNSKLDNSMKPRN